MSVDVRAGKTFGGPDDPKFVELTLYLHLPGNSGSRRACVEDLVECLSKACASTNDLCEEIGKLWAETPATSLPFRLVFTIAKLFGCANKAENDQLELKFEPELNQAVLVEKIKTFLAADLAKVAKKTAEGEKEHIYVLFYLIIGYLCIR